MKMVQLKNGQQFFYSYDDSDESIAQGGRPDGFCTHTWGTPLPKEHAWGLAEGGQTGLPLHEVTFNRRPEGDIITADTNLPRQYVPHETGVVACEATLDGEWMVDKRIDEDGYTLREANAAGFASEFRYDARGNLTHILDPADNQTQLHYENDRLVRRINPDGHETRYHYDGFGALIEARFADGRRYTFDYDTQGRLAAIFGGKDADTRLYAFSYDDQHNLVRQTTARGAITEYAFDALGRPVQRRDAIGRVTALHYDRLGRPVAVQRPDG